jgi:hypothetical protein
VGIEIGSFAAGFIPNKSVVTALQADQKRWVDFMMRFELGLEEPDPKRARKSAWTIALSYIAGGLEKLI